jgi:hypothetical protein
MSMLFDDDTAEAGLKMFQIGELMILKGYRDMGRAVIDTYMNTAIDGGLDAISHQIKTSIEFVQVQITRELSLSVTVVNVTSRARIAKTIARLKTGYEIWQKSKEFIDEYPKDEGGKACKALNIIDLVSTLGFGLVDF